jgi:hypothetical protein
MGLNDPMKYASMPKPAPMEWAFWSLKLTVRRYRNHDFNHDQQFT